jgi:nicotinate-nucleotide pyrophosphorylase (carboxylating)
MKSEIVRTVEKLLKQAIEEDVRTGDITTGAVLKQNVRVQARVVAKGAGIVCGVKVIEKIAAMVDKQIKVAIKKKDGARIKQGDIIVRLSGPARSILKIERLCLNFLGRLSSIATMTAAYVAKTKKYRVKIYDTRKTTPNLRLFERCAVRAGGGCNHRFGLFDQVLIKDNHIVVAGLHEQEPSLEKMVRRAREKVKKGILIEVEVDTLQQLKQVLKASPDIILLDNMAPATLRRAIKIVSDAVKEKGIQRPVLEASGGITLKNVANIAKTGVNRISIGALTHSATNINYSLEIL